MQSKRSSSFTADVRTLEKKVQRRDKKIGPRMAVSGSQTRALARLIARRSAKSS